MMAKMFYTLDEAKAALGKNEEEIKQFAREGRLREFRDGPRLMFKADQVEALKAELGGGGSSQRDQVDLGVSDTGAPIGLVDSQRSSGGSAISLVDTDAGRSGGSAMGGSALGGSALGASGSGIGMAGLKDDTALAADLGLGGSLGGVPSPGRSGMVSSGSGLSGSRSAVNVLGESSAGADPAQTAINASVADQVNLEGVGSGSGLLDLTRESDDTSLGAELLDEIAPGGSRGGSRRGSSAGGSGTGLEGTGAPSGTSAGSSISAAIPRRQAGGTVIQVEAPDPLAGALGAACLAAAIMALLGAVAIFSAVLGTRPPLLEIKWFQNFLYLAGIGVGLTVVFFIIGMFVGKPRTR